jgi:signal-transduction protein with cAMP-binding, CBS, and nucleotidyltransferase domain
VQYGETISILRGIPLFSKLDPKKLKLLAFSSQYQTFEAGEELFHEGDAADGAYIIEEGEVDVLSRDRRPFGRRDLSRFSRSMPMYFFVWSRRIPKRRWRSCAPSARKSRV